MAYQLSLAHSQAWTRCGSLTREKVEALENGFEEKHMCRRIAGAGDLEGISHLIIRDALGKDVTSNFAFDNQEKSNEISIITRNNSTGIYCLELGDNNAQKLFYKFSVIH